MHQYLLFRERNKTGDREGWRRGERERREEKGKKGEKGERGEGKERKWERERRPKQSTNKRVHILCEDKIEEKRRGEKRREESEVIG